MEAAEASSRSAERETPLSFISARKGEFFRRKKRGNHKWGFPFITANFSATFFFDTKGAKKKVRKKETPGFISRSAERDQGSAFGIRELLKKLDQNFCLGLVQT